MSPTPSTPSSPGKRISRSSAEPKFSIVFVQTTRVSGVIKPLMEQGYEVVPTVFASAVPNGEVDHDFYMNLKAEIIRVAKEEQAKKPIDAITLALHGSMRVKGLGEAEATCSRSFARSSRTSRCSARWTCTPP